MRRVHRWLRHSGFTASIVILSLPLFALALLVGQLPFLDSSDRSLKAVAGD